jgi:ATPase, P-type (transporting), HAD superfamily, subfamily IC
MGSPGRGAGAGAVARPDPHHSLAAHEVVLILEGDLERGLAEPEARRRLERYGPNVLPRAGTAGPLVRLLRQFHHPLIYVLLVAGLVTILLRDFVDAAVILVVVLVNAVVGFIQESRATAALEGLRAMVRTRARVIRDGAVTEVPSAELVPGDLVLLEAGDKVPADLRLVRCAELRADESALTGESVPVAKDEIVLPAGTPVADRRNMVYSGTSVTSGTATGIVVATGAETEIGEIHRLVGRADPLATPLTRKLAAFSEILTVAILAVALLTFVLGTVRGEPAGEMFLAAVALAVAAIPEGLPAAVTITLAIGVSRMAARRAVIRRLPAVETLGGTTVICTDKTGTLTENQMTVCAVRTAEREVTVTGSGYAPAGGLFDAAGRRADPAEDEALRWSLLAGACCNDAAFTVRQGRRSVTGDPTEAAMLVAADKAGLGHERVRAAFPRIAELPFSSGRRYMATLHDAPDGDRVLFVKGAAERLARLCAAHMAADGGARPLDPDAVLRAADELAGRGLRVLATAMGRMPATADPQECLAAALRSGTLVFTGLQAMFDPPRPAAAGAVRACRDAGIAVKMITGDHATTAAAVARRIGIRGEVRTGADLAGLPGPEFSAAVERAAVFARVSPEQKLHLVEALQRRRHVVAMTGDGVNDAPALRRADIGIAMGRGGTEVAKDAADMVLTDDDFATIEAAVEEGRCVFDNLTKFIVWTLPTNAGEGMVVLAAVVLGLALPILPVQILWINMITAVTLGLTLAFEPKEPGLMRRPPRDPDRPLLTGALMVRVLLVAVLMIAGAWWLFEWELRGGAGLAEARTAAVNLFVMVELCYLFNCRSLTLPAWRVGLLSNRWLLAGVGLQILAQLAITYLPVMNRVFQTAPIDAAAWLRVLAFAAAASLIVAMDKRVRGGRL